MLVISSTQTPMPAWSVVFIEGGPDNLQSSKPWEKIKFYDIVNAWKTFPAVPYKWVCEVLLLEYLQNYAVLLDFHCLGLSAHWTD